MALHLSEQEYRQLTKKTEPVKPKRKREAQKPTAHDWHLEGKFYICICCDMRLPLWAWPNWQTGQYRP